MAVGQKVYSNLFNSVGVVVAILSAGQLVVRFENVKRRCVPDYYGHIVKTATVRKV